MVKDIIIIIIMHLSFECITFNNAKKRTIQDVDKYFCI